MFLRRLLPVCLAAAAALFAAEPKASDLYRQARKAERSGDVVRAYLLYSEAAAKDPRCAECRIRADALQIRAALKAHAMPATDASAKPSPAQPEAQPEPAGLFSAISDEELADIRRLKPPPELKASPGTKTLDLHGDAKVLFQQAAGAFELGVAFDPEYEAGPTLRLHLDNVDYRQALRAVEAATGSFVFPVGQRLIMAVKDTPQKRVAFEPTIAVTVPIPDALTPQDAQEVGRSVQQALDISKLSVDTERRMVLIRDRISRVRPAQALLDQLSHSRAQVMLEMQFVEVDRASTLSYGLLVPSSFPMPFIGGQGAASLVSDPTEKALLAALGTAIPLAKIVNLSPIMFGLGIANSGLFATMTKSSSKTLLDSSVRSLDGATADFHVGDKYPILTGALMGNSTTSFGSITTTTGTTTPMIGSVQWTGSPGNYALLISGSGFGSATVPLAFTGDVPNFAIADQAQQAEWGYTGDANTLTYLYWSDSAIAVSGFGGQPGDAVVISLWNSFSQAGAAWGGNVPTTTATTPQITSVQLSGTGQDIQIVVQGSGFGAAPASMPAAGSSGNLNYFRFWDFRSHCGAAPPLFEAGYGSDSVTLGYQSWSDSQIVISGFGGTYGQGCATYQAGDPVAIAIWNTAGAGVTGLQTAWGGGTSTGTTSTSGSTSAGSLASVPSFNFEDLGLVLKVTPHVHGTEAVSLDVTAEFKVLTSQSANGIPVIAARKLESKVRVRDGEWAVVAGLMSLSDAKTITGVPVLSRIPGIGDAMRKNERDRDGNDVILLLRPILLDAPPDQSLTRQLWVGSETRMEIPL